MSQSSASAVPLQPVAIAPIPVRELAPWAVFGVLLTIVVMYFVGSEQGATALVGGEAIHEWVHDARHLLGYPCH